MEIENHPIPQDITGFQFRLIGDMTIKQFGYLATGFIFAWIFYISPLFFIIKIPLALLSAVTGAALAFVPIQGRPIDTMIVIFLRAVFRPSQFVYQQLNENLDEKDTTSVKRFNKERQTISDMSEKQLQDFLLSLPKTTRGLEKKEMVFFKNINQYQVAPQAPTQALPGFVAQHAYANSAPTPQPVPQELPRLPEAQTPPGKITTQQTPISTIEQQVAAIQEDTTGVTQKIPVKPEADPKEFLEAHQKVLELQKSLGEMQLQKQQLEEKLTTLQKQTNKDDKKIFAPSLASATPQPQTQLVRSIPQNMTKSIGMISAPEFPNIISGIVKDPRGNPLSNILVEVKDLQGNAVRAFKTNALGQFASATTLMNGDYTIEFDDPRGQNKFDIVGFKASGEIILPLEVTSVDTREELRRSLFN